MEKPELRVAYEPRGPVERQLVSGSFLAKRNLRSWLNSHHIPSDLREDMTKVLQYFTTMIDEYKLRDVENHSDDETGGVLVDSFKQDEHDLKSEWYNEFGPTPTPYTHPEPQYFEPLPHMKPLTQYMQPPTQYMEPSSQYMQPSSQYNQFGKGSSHPQSFSVGDTQPNFMDILFRATSYDEYQLRDPAFNPAHQQMPMLQLPLPLPAHTESERYEHRITQHLHDPNVPPRRSINLDTHDLERERQRITQKSSWEQADRGDRGGRGDRRRRGVLSSFSNVVSNVIRPNRQN